MSSEQSLAMCMSLSHDFIICNLPNNATFDELRSFYRTNKGHATRVRDKWMLKYWGQFDCIPSYWDGVSKLEHGLNYYCFSLIPAQYVPDLLSATCSFPCCIYFRKLQLLCNDAIAAGC